MTATALFSQAVLSSLVLLTVCGLRRSDLRLAYVTDHSLYYCTCVRAPPPCGLISPADCSCKDRPLSTLLRPDSSSAVRLRHLTVWYASALNAARLLNSSEVRHLTLIRCGSVGAGKPPSPPGAQDYFAVHHLECLTVASPPWRATDSQEVVLGRETGAAYPNEARLGLVHSSVLLGGASVKAYTVQTHIDSQGVLPFPNLFLPRLPETSSISVTFIY